MFKTIGSIALGIGALLSALYFLNAGDGHQSSFDEKIPAAEKSKTPGGTEPKSYSALFLPDVTGSAHLDVLRAAVLSGNDAEMDSALQKLNRHLEEHPETFPGILAAFRSETEPLLIRCLAESIAWHWNAEMEKSTVQTALEVLQNDRQTLKRYTALTLLTNAVEISSDTVQKIRLVSQDDPDPQTRSNALLALTHFREK